MTETPRNNSGAATVVKVRFASPAQLRRVADEQIRQGSLFVATAEARPALSWIELHLAVAGIEGAIRVTGTVGTPQPGDPSPGLRIRVDDLDDVMEEVDSFLMLAGAMLPNAVVQRGAQRIKIRLRFDGTDAARAYFEREIVRGEAFVEAAEPKPPGSQVELVLAWPTYERGLHLAGEVIHTVYPGASEDAPGMAVRLAPPSPELRQEIDDHLYGHAVAAKAPGETPVAARAPAPSEAFASALTDDLDFDAPPPGAAPAPREPFVFPGTTTPAAAEAPPVAVTEAPIPSPAEPPPVAPAAPWVSHDVAPVADGSGDGAFDLPVQFDAGPAAQSAPTSPFNTVTGSDTLHVPDAQQVPGVEYAPPPPPESFAPPAPPPPPPESFAPPAPPTIDSFSPPPDETNLDAVWESEPPPADATIAYEPVAFAPATPAGRHAFDEVSGVSSDVSAPFAAPAAPPQDSGAPTEGTPVSADGPAGGPAWFAAQAPARDDEDAVLDLLTEAAPLESRAQASGGAERRTSDRIGARVQVKLRPIDLRQFRDLYTRDISRGGVYVYSDNPHPVGTIVEVLLFVPGSDEPFVFEGSVIHIVTVHDVRGPGELPGMGIRFDHIDERARSQIEGIISRVTEEAPPPPPPQYSEQPPVMYLAPASVVAAPAAAALPITPAPVAPPLMAPPSAPPPATLASTSTVAWTGAAPAAVAPAPPEPAPRSPVEVERRVDPQDPSRTQLVLRYFDLEAFRNAYHKDISRGGALLPTAEAIALRSIIDVVLLPPGVARGLTLKSEVVHVVPGDPNRPGSAGLGVQFTDLTPKKKEAIEAFLSGAGEGVFNADDESRRGQAARKQTSKKKSVGRPVVMSASAERRAEAARRAGQTLPPPVVERVDPSRDPRRSAAQHEPPKPTPSLSASRTVASKPAPRAAPPPPREPAPRAAPPPSREPPPRAPPAPSVREPTFDFPEPPPLQVGPPAREPAFDFHEAPFSRGEPKSSAPEPELELEGVAFSAVPSSPSMQPLISEDLRGFAPPPEFPRDPSLGGFEQAFAPPKPERRAPAFEPAPTPPPSERRAEPARPKKRGGEDDLDRLLDLEFADQPGTPVDFDNIEVVYEGSAHGDSPRKPGKAAPREATMVLGSRTRSAPLPPLSAADAQELLGALETALRKSYYDALGVRPNATREEIDAGIDARMRPFREETYAALDPPVARVLGAGRDRLERVVAILRDPESRAHYECTASIFLDIEEYPVGPERDARMKVRAQFRERFAQEFPDKVRKAEDYFRAALEELRGNRKQAALELVKLALAYFPLSDRYMELQRKLQPR
jgi:Tfp pilus assembly protein PilZ